MAACWPRHGVSTAARPMGGYIDKSYDSSGSDSRRGSTNSRDPPRPAARAFAVLRSMTSSANDVSHVRLDSTMLGSSADVESGPRAEVMRRSGHGGRTHY